MRLFLARLRSPLIAAAAIVALSVPARAQVLADALTTAASQSAQAPPPVAAQPPAPQTPPPAPAGPLMDTSTSLFALRPNQLQLSGRLSSMSGDPARWQRYQDLRDGLLFTGVRLQRETPEWSGTVERRQRRLARSALCRRPTNGSAGSRSADSGTRSRSSTASTPAPPTRRRRPTARSCCRRRAAVDPERDRQRSTRTSPVVSPQFDLRERRDIGTFGLKATPTTQLDVTGGFTTTKHSGELPWGASFGFSNDVEVALPYESRTNDLDIGLEWHNTKSMLRTAYTNSWFDNQADTLIWDSPLRLTDAAELPGRGRMALWPSNSMQTLSAAGHTKLARRTQVTGSLAFGWWSNDQALQPFTINSALPTFALPRANADAKAQSISTNLSLVSRPADDWRFSTRFRRYDFNNDTPGHRRSPTSSTTTPHRRPVRPAAPSCSRTTATRFDADATWTGLGPVALTFGYTNNHNGYDYRIFESSNEHVLQLKADAVLPRGMTFRTHYEYGTRNGSGFDEAALIEIGEQPALRHYDLANRTRNRFVGQLDVAPRESLTFSVSGGVGTDDFDDSGFGLQETAFSNMSIGRRLPDRGRRQRRRQLQLRALHRPAAVALGEPGRAADGSQPRLDRRQPRERALLLGLRPAAPHRHQDRDARVLRLLARQGELLLRGRAGAAAAVAAARGVQQAAGVQVRRSVIACRAGRLLTLSRTPTSRFASTTSRSIRRSIDSIVQPSSLVLGYTYRPYTAHSAVFGLLYYW